MKTATSRLTASQRRALRAAIDHAVRTRLGTPARTCPECGANLTDLPAPVYGCTTCHERYWRRRQRANKR
jgi:hypothetical protein